MRAKDRERGAEDLGGFAHLHLHTEYSLLDGGNQIGRLVARVRELGMGAVAITDHGNLFGALAFYEACRREGVRPILGCEAYVAHGDRTDRTYTGVQDGGHHLVLLAENNTGWRNLLRLASEAYLTGFYFKPRVDRALLEECADGLIAINGHLGSELAHHLVEFEKTKREEHWERALDVARWHASTFRDRGTGPRFYVELQRHIPEQEAINPHLVRLARELDLPLVCDNDAHFLLETDWDAHDTLCCISMGKTKAETNRLRYPTQLYVKSPEEMRELFADAPEAVENTVRIAARCDVELEFGNHAPVVRVVRPSERAGYPGAGDLTEWFKEFCDGYSLEPFDSTRDGGSQSELEAECDAALRELCEAGLVWRYGPTILSEGDDAPGAPGGMTAQRKSEIRARLDRELSILSDKRISAYFLIVWDFVNWGRQRGVPALARGSGVGTMVGYTLGLSNACPVRYGLLFERFTDPNRSEYPDIDIDLCQDRRADVIAYVREKYGHVAQIITFGTLKARAAIRDVGRVLEAPLPDVDRVAKLIPEHPKMTIDLAMQQEPELRRLHEEDDLVRRMLDTARTLEGQARHASVHAAGVIVATRPLHEIVPLYKAPGSEDVVTQWDGPTCEKVGLLKMDFLGLRTLSVIERAKQLIRDSLPESEVRRAVGWAEGREGDPLDLDRLTFDDPRVFECFQRADTTGVFQFESGGMRRLLAEMKPDRLGDLIAANALFRPGPMDLIPDYNRRKHGQEQIPSVHPIVDAHTAETYGIMVYQEQVMQICHELGGIPLRDAYSLIKAISKKKQSVIDAERPKFVAGAEERGLGRRAAEELFDLILKFAGYGFNKSHSTAYAIIAYQTAYLKTYFPNQYMAAFLTYESGALKVEEWIRYLDDCRKTVRPDGGVGLEVRPPDINASRSDFSVVFDDGEARDNAHGHIRFGLRAIKGVGARAIESIVEEREKSGPFRSLHDLCERAPSGAVNRATIEALVCSGSLDSLHGRERRAAMAASIEGALAAGQSLAADRASGQGALFGGGDEAASAAGEPALSPAQAWGEQETLKREKETLGFYVSAHPLDRWKDLLEAYSSVDCVRARELPDGTRIVLGGMVKSVRLISTKKGDRMAIVTFEDKAGTVEVVLFPRALAQVRERLGERLAPDSGLFFVGQVDRSRGEAQIIAEDALLIEDAPNRLTSRVELLVDERALNGGAARALEEAARIAREAALQPSSGARAPLTLVVRTSGGGAVVLESKSVSLAPSPDVLALLSRVVGASNVRLRGGVMPASNGLNDRPWDRRNGKGPARRSA